MFVFWQLVFVFNQLLFLLYNVPTIRKAGIEEILVSFYHSVPLNISAASYFLVIPVIVSFSQPFIRFPFVVYFNRIFVAFLLLIVSAICTAELALYEEWGTKLNIKALMYLKRPQEVWQTASVGFTILFFVLVLGQIIGFSYVYKRWFSELGEYKKTELKKLVPLSVLYLIVGLGLLLLGIRGGWQPIPINQSASYYSRNQTLNWAATNSFWNVSHSLWQNRKNGGKNEYLRYPKNDAEQIVKELHAVKTDTTISFLTIPKPNVVYIILEGWTSDVVGCIDGEKGFTPGFDQLAKEGMLYTNCYASGVRSEQGMMALFSGFPAQTVVSIIEQPDKFSKVPSIIEPFKKNNYYTSFYFGGQLSYGNIESYMIFNGVDKIVDTKNLPGSYPSGKLGVHDEFMFQHLLKEIPRQPEPFFTSYFTLSTHTPYDLPSKISKSWNLDGNDYLKSIYYSDSCLSAFIANAKKQAWYKNTLFVIVADHGHMCYTNRSYFAKEHHKIPLLFFGDVIKPEFRNKKDSSIVSQTDVTTTVLAQLNMPYKQFKWSRNMMNPYTKKFAFFSYPNGIGWIIPKNFYTYDYGDYNRYGLFELNDSSQEKTLLKQGQSYLQVLFQEYLDY